MLEYGINKLLVKGAKDLSSGKCYTRVNARTGDEIRELRDYVMYGDPEKRYINIPERKNNLCAQVVEMMMVLSGNPDLKYLSLFLPRAIDYSDDEGKTWRGNYGIRIRGNKAFSIGENNSSFQFSRYNKDNLKNVIDTLKVDPSSRQCFITIGDSNLDRFIKTKDTPCTMTLVFGVTASNLVTLTTFMRSNDIIFGFSGVNYFIFTCLQELVASILGYDLGVYCHHPVSFHIYSWKYDLLDKISNVDENTIQEVTFNKGLFRGFESLEQFDKLAEDYFSYLENCESIDEFKRILSVICPNENLLAMLVSTYAYLHQVPMSEFKPKIFGTDLANSGLLDRDIFFNKKVK